MLDLQEETRRDDVFNELLDINDRITKLPVFPTLGWVWTFDILRDIFDNADVGYDQAIADGVTLKQIFDKFYEDIDSLGIDMDMGGEILQDTIRDWMIDNDFLVDLEEEEE